MAIMTAAQRAQAYLDLIDKIVAGGPDQTFDVMGSSWTRHDLEKLERLADKYRAMAAAETYGHRAVVDLS